MEKVTFYEGIFNEIKGNTLSYLALAKPLDPMEPVVKFLKYYFNLYKYRILIIIKDLNEAVELRETLKNYGLLKYQIDKIDIQHISAIDSIIDPKDAVIGYKLAGFLTIDDIQAILNLRDLTAYNKPKIIFIDEEVDNFVKNTVENSSLSHFVRCMAVLNNEDKKKNAKIFLHPLDLGRDITEEYVFYSQFKAGEPIFEVKTNYGDFISKRPTYASKQNFKVDVSCSPLQMYSLLLTESAGAMSVALAQKCEEAVARYKIALLRTKTFLANKKKEVVSQFLKLNKDKKIAIVAANKDQANYFGLNNIIDIASDEQIIDDELMKFNSDIQKNICIRTTVPNDLELNRTEMVVFAGINGNETSLINEVVALNGLTCHIFYYKVTKEESKLKKILANIDPNIIYKYND